MKKNKTQKTGISGRFFCVLCVAALAAFALFAACERPEPEPEPPTPPVVNPAQSINKFVGTWVLCGQSSADEEPPCACIDSLTSLDTLIFTTDNFLTIKHGSEFMTSLYDYTPSFLLFYEPDQQLTPHRVVYSFRMEDTELKITGDLFNIPGTSSKTISCFVKIDTPTNEPAVVPEVPISNRYLGTWASCCAH